MTYVEANQFNVAQEALAFELRSPIQDRDVRAVLENGAAIQPLLEAAGLGHVASFWRTYLAVSQEVYDGLGTGEFRRDDDVAKTLPIFYELARKPLIAYLENRPEDMPLEWRRLLYGPKLREADPGMQFAAFMGVHISNDLPVALYLSGVDDEYKPDFTKVVGDKLEVVARRYASEYIPTKSPQLQQFVLSACLAYIDVAREKAWRDGKKLQSVDYDKAAVLKTMKKIEIHSVRQGIVLQKAGSLALSSAMKADGALRRYSRV